MNCAPCAFFFFEGLPAKPMIVSSVNIKTNPITNIQSAEIKWAVDSYEPLVQYQLQYKRQQVRAVKVRTL